MLLLMYNKDIHTRDIISFLDDNYHMINKNLFNKVIFNIKIIHLVNNPYYKDNSFDFHMIDSFLVGKKIILV